MVQHEPLSAFTAEELGLLRSLGIVKGAAFQPDEPLRRLLADGARLLDARTLFHYTAIVVTPAMEAKMVGVGSQYLTAYKDASGA